MSKTIMCGVDLHDKSLVCRVAGGRSQPVTKTYGNSQRGRRELFAYLKAEAERQSSDRVVVAYEASTQGFCLYDDCRDVGIECFILAPTKIRKSRKDRKKKGDEQDAQLIFETLRGHVLAGNDLPAIWVPDDQARADRETVRARLDLGQKLTGVKTQVRTLLKARRLRKPKAVGNSWTAPHRQWLDSLCSGDRHWPALATLLRQVEFLEREIACQNKEVARLAQTPRYAKPTTVLVGSLKGVGLLTAMVFLTEMGDMTRFANRRQVGAFLGLVPSSNESGETNDRKGHITREGSARLRQVLCQASWSRINSDPGEWQFYNRLVERNPKHKKIAVVAVMRRLGIRMWHLALSTQQHTGIFANRQSTSTATAA